MVLVIKFDIISLRYIQEELEVPYEVKFYYRTAEGLAPAELKAVHPLALSPVITDGDFTLAESGPVVGMPYNVICKEMLK